MVKSKPTQDSMSLWWLGAPAHLAAPRKIGQLLLTDGNRKVGLTYSDEWLQHGFALSEDLPLARGVFLPKELDMAAGAIDDARPDRWGERVIRNLYRPDRLSVLEYLYFAGDDRFGALGVSMLADAYQPCANGAMSSLNSLPEMERAIAAVLADQPLDEKWTRLLSPGPSFGGARPKSLIEMEGSQWVVKFSAGEDFDTELVEHATLRLAAQCGIQVVKSRALRLAHGHAVAVKRFDRQGGQRSHVISANTVFRAAGLQQGYPELAQALRRIGRSETIRSQQTELFTRMVFNILMDNTDDHEKNHAFIRADDGFYALSPAFDVVPSVQGLGQQQLRVGLRGAESTIENALSEVQAFGLNKDTATQVVRRVVDVVNGWKDAFQALGVTSKDIQQLEQYIDGPRLKTQRQQFSQ